MTPRDLIADAGPEPGDRGPVVRALQEYLQGQGFALGVDGIYGPQTTRCVRLWQLLRLGREYVDEGTLAACMMIVEYTQPEPEDHEAAAALIATLPPSIIAADDYDPIWPTLAQMRADCALVQPVDRDDLIAWVAVWLLTQGITEERQNRGPWVDVLIALGGGDYEAADPWCARFVAACRGLSNWLRPDELRDYPRTGSAARTWIACPERDRLEREEAAWLAGSIGGAFVRSRTSAPVWHREVILRGEPMQGHTGIVVDLEADGFTAVAGNSSGQGHSAGSGSVALEVLSPTSGHALRAWERLVGIAHTSEIGK